MNLNRGSTQTKVPSSAVSIVKAAEGDIETVLVVDHDLRVIAMGAAPNAEYSSGHISCGRFTTGSAYWDARLRQLIASGSPAQIQPRADAGDRAISVMPMKPLNDGVRHCQAVIVTRQAKEPCEKIDTIRQACGLTATEADVLGYIYKGLSTVEVARKLGIATSTARTHLSHIFDKTATSRQSELVYFVSSFP